MKYRQFVVAPTVTKTDHATINSICDGLERLINDQSLGGYWGGSALIDKLVCSAHATMALVAAGYSHNDPNLVRAVNWLCSNQASKQTASYWILGPLSSLHNPPKETIDRELNKLRDVLGGGAKIHKDQLVEAYYLRIERNFPDDRHREFREQMLDAIRQSLSAHPRWKRRSDSSTDAYAALFVFDYELSQSQKTYVSKLLKDQANLADPCIAWGTQISTMYTIMNILSTDLQDDEELIEIVEMAVKRIQEWYSAKVWNGDVPYGGEGDIKSFAFPASVYLRCIMSYAHYHDKDFATKIQAEMLSRKNHRRKNVITILAVLCVVFLLLPVERWIYQLVQNIFGEKMTSTILPVLGVVGAILGIITTVIALIPRDLRRKLIGDFNIQMRKYLSARK